MYWRPGGHIFDHNLDGVPGEMPGIGFEERFQFGIENDPRASDGAFTLDRRERRDDEDVRERDTEDDTGSLEGESHDEMTVK